MRFAMTSLSCAFLLVASAAPAAPADAEAYNRCTSAAMSPSISVEEAIAACRPSAAAAIPGAMYALGDLLLQRDPADPEGVAWLEKAVATGHPPATLRLAEFHLDSGDASRAQRGRTLLQDAACSGYPLAVTALMKRGLTPSATCRKTEYANFRGTWSGKVESVKSGGGASELTITIDGQNAKVFLVLEDETVEVKPGKFVMNQKDASLVISALDIGWDFDGQWIESWTIHLLRLNADEAFVNFTRTVNNPDMPAASEWRTFTQVSEGRFTRRPNAARTNG